MRVTKEQCDNVWKCIRRSSPRATSPLWRCTRMIARPPATPTRSCSLRATHNEQLWNPQAQVHCEPTYDAHGLFERQAHFKLHSASIRTPRSGLWSHAAFRPTAYSDFHSVTVDEPRRPTASTSSSLTRSRSTRRQDAPRWPSDQRLTRFSNRCLVCHGLHVGFATDGLHVFFPKKGKEDHH